MMIYKSLEDEFSGILDSSSLWRVDRPFSVVLSVNAQKEAR